MPDVPRLLAGRYRLDSVIGRGGMGLVWLGVDETLGREVAVKEVRLPPQLDDEEREALCERMLREARLTAQLSHPGVVTVYDVVSDDSRPFIVMELVRAPSLSDEVARAGPLPPHRVAGIGLALLDALDAAHQDGIVHRDVKPSNVLLSGERVVLSDFGIAISESDPRMTSTGLLVGSPTYMSPERLRGQPTGPPADLWSLGATLYAAVEGHPPFDAGTTMGTVSAVLTDELPPPPTRGSLREAIVGLLDKDPTRRYDVQRTRALLRSAVTETAAGVGTAVQAEPLAPPTAAPRPRPGADTPTSGTTVLRVDQGRPPSVTASRGGVGGRAGGRVGGRWLLGAAALLAVLAVVVLVGVLLSRGPDATPSAGGSTPSSDEAAEDPATSDAPATEDPATEDPATEDPATEDPATEDPATEDPVVPVGFRLRTDPLGFEVAAPVGWQRSLDGPTRVDFVSPDGSMFLRVDQVAEAGPSAEQAWLDAEEPVSQELPGYERIRIESVDYRSYDTADWEFVWEGDSGTVHVLNRGVATDTRGFALYVSTPDSAWEDEGMAVFEAAADSFQPIE